MLIVVDGAVDLPLDLVHSPRVRVVSGDIRLDDEHFHGSGPEFWDLLRRGATLSTSPPTVAALTEAYRQSEQVCALHVSGELSATLAHAQDAAGLLGQSVTTIDTRSLSVGAGLIAARVHQAIEEGIPDTSILDLARSLPQRIHTFAVVQDTGALRRSGRAGLLPSDRLHAGRPLLIALRGRAVALDQAKKRSDIIRRLASHAADSSGHSMTAWALGHGDAADARDVTAQLTKAFGMAPEFDVPLDLIVAVHVGPESLVVGVYA